MIAKFPADCLTDENISALDLSRSEIEEMCEEMRTSAWNVNGLGIAAPQIEKNYRIFGVIHPEKKRYIWFLDPEILSMSGETTYDEGCLSIPGYFWPVTRHDKLTVSYFDEKKKKHVKTISGIYSRIFQHEIDHIDGILIPEYLDDAGFSEFYSHFSSGESISSYTAPAINLL